MASLSVLSIIPVTCFVLGSLLIIFVTVLRSRGVSVERPSDGCREVVGSQPVAVLIVGHYI